jgi:hypothetical protein
MQSRKPSSARSGRCKNRLIVIEGGKVGLGTHGTGITADSPPDTVRTVRKPGGGHTLSL